MSDRVLLVTMPFGPMTRPAVGISLLKAELAERGVACDLRYLNLRFAALLGIETYHEISESLPTSSLIGDWLFRETLFGPDPERDDEYLDEHLPHQYPGVFAPPLSALYRDCRALAEPFLESCMREVEWERYGVVGFTTTFQQTVPSLALARRVKEAHPGVVIAFGGANCEGEMGRELHRQFPFVDAVFSGESDHTFPVFAAHLVSRPRRLPPLLPGVCSRLGSHPVAASPPSMPVEHLDELPYPDYSDFAAALRQHGLAGRYNVQYLFETSRGCWWGEKHHCTFCGLNGQSMRFRSKSPGRVVAELRHLVERYGADTVWGTDNILDTHYFKTVLPVLKELDLRVNLFFETKANLRKEQLRLMRDVGIGWFQPGIESLNSHQLRLMRKGTTALQNIQLLKWVRQYRMVVTWNLLMGFPGETADDYVRMAGYCDAISHLQPPSGAHPIRLDRFSPYHDAPHSFGITDVQPYPTYRYIYPFDDEALRRLAYFFTFGYSDGYDPLQAGRPVLDAVARWMLPSSLSLFYAIGGDNMLVLCDTRPVARQGRIVLTGHAMDAYLYCDAIRSFDSVVRHIGERHAGVGEGEVRALLEEMVEARLMLEEDGHYLSLAVLVDEDTDLGPLVDQRNVDRAARREVAEPVPL